MIWQLTEMEKKEIKMNEIKIYKQLYEKLRKSQNIDIEIEEYQIKMEEILKKTISEATEMFRNIIFV